MISIVLLYAAFGAHFAQAAEPPFIADLVVSLHNGEISPHLQWSPATAEVTWEPTASRWVAKAVAHTTQEDSTVLVAETGIPGKPVKEKPSDFVVEIPLDGEVTSFTLYLINPLGEIEKVKVIIAWRTLKEAELRREFYFPVIRHFGAASVGYTTIAYKQTLIPQYFGAGVTVKGSYVFLVKPPHWDIGGNAFFTLFPLGSNQSGTTTRFLGVNARTGYRFKPWKSYEFSLLGGFYFRLIGFSSG